MTLDYPNFKNGMADECPRWNHSELIGIWSITARHQYNVRQRTEPRRDSEFDPTHEDDDTAELPF